MTNASVNLYKRKDLWLELGDLQACNPLPRDLSGDFNEILGAYEQRGILSPSKPLMEDFKNWTKK